MEQLEGQVMGRMGEHLDLRRRVEALASGRLIRRAHWLDPHDRELILAMFDRGQNATSIAIASRSSPRLVRRRIKQLIARLNDPRVAYVVAHQGHWGRTRQSVARDLFVRGCTMRQVSERLGVSLHCVRKHRDAIEAMAAAAQDDARTSRTSRTWRNAEQPAT